MNNTRQCLALIVIIGLTSIFAACNSAREEESASNTAATAAPAAPVPGAATIGDLIGQVVAGDGKAPVKEWIAAKQPYAEAYSFIEYPPDFAAGHAYYWGDWQTRAADYCAVRTLRDYTPVQIDFTLGWYSGLSGRSVAELKDEYLAFHAQSGGTKEENIGAGGERIGDTYMIETDEFRAGLFTRDETGEQLAICAVMLKPTQLAVVSEKNREFAELLEFADEDQPATLAELVATLAAQGGRGILDHFDFRAFKRGIWYEPLDGSDPRSYRQATIYNSGLLRWNNPSVCYFAAFDAGDSAQLTFTTGWYANHCGHSAKELNASFDELFAAAGNGQIELDSTNDAYDVEFAWAYLDGVNVVRRRYLNPPQPFHAHYTLLAGDELFADAPPRFPTWLPADLPAPPAEAGELAQLIDEIAETAPGQFLPARAAGARHEQVELDLFLIQPFTMRDYYTLTDPITQHRLCAAQILDESYMEDFGFNPQWFEAQTGLTRGELEHEFTVLAGQFGVTAAAATMQPGESAAFDYGPLTITYRRGLREDQADDWYSITPPVWPDEPR